MITSKSSQAQIVNLSIDIFMYINILKCTSIHSISNQKQEIGMANKKSFVLCFSSSFLFYLDWKIRKYIYSSGEHSPTFNYIQRLLFIIEKTNWESNFAKLTRLKFFYAMCLTKPNLEGEEREEVVQLTA